MKKKVVSLLLAMLMVLSTVTVLPMTVFATGTTYAITNGTPESAKETNHGYISIDKSTAAEGETVTITVNPAKGYQLKSLTVTPVATFKAVYNTKDSANTLTFYYDAVDHSGEGITVYEDGTTNYLFDNSKSKGAKWGYNSIRSSVKSVKIDSTVANYTGLTSTAYMFYDMEKAENISGAEYLDVSQVTNMAYMFYEYGYQSSTLNIVPDVSEWNTGKVTNMSYMFYRYGYKSTALNAVPDMSMWNTVNVTTVTYMFYCYGNNSTALSTVPNVSGWNTGNLTNMASMFSNYGCSSIKLNFTLDLSDWSVASVDITTSAYGKMFESAATKAGKWSVTIPGFTGAQANDKTHWYVGDGTATEAYIEPASGKQFTVPAAPTEYNVTFDLNGITGTAPTAQTIKDGEKVTKPADPTDTVHTFAGWYKTKDATTGALSDPWDFDNGTVTANMTLYAQWTRTLESIYTGSDIPKVTNNSAPDDAWENGDGGKAFIAYSTGNTVLYLYKQLQPSGAKQLSCRKTENFTKIGDDYVLFYELGGKQYGVFTLHMTDGKFTSVTYDGTGTDYEVLSGTYSPQSQCIAVGTMISMPGGNQKAVEELEIGDVINTFDHETGEVSSAPVCFIWESKNAGNAFTLTFEDDVEVTVIEEHGFYDQEEQKYVFINLQNAEEYIGDHFYNADTNSWLALKNCEALNESIDAYAIITSGDLNHMSNGMLSMCDGTVKVLANIFEYDNQMKFDADKKKADIEAYGLTPKEKILELEGFIESDYDDYNLQYLNVAIGKGLTTWEWIEAFSDYCVENGLVDIYSGSETAEKNEAPKMLLMSATAPKTLLGSTPEPTPQDGIEIKANENGTYTFIMPGYPVTITAEFEEKAITIADILPDDFPTCVDVLPPNLWVNGNEVNMMVLPYSIEIFTLDEYGNPDYVELVNDIRTATLTKNGNNYTYTNNGVTTTFLMSDNGLESVKIEGLTGEYVDFNGTYGEQHAHSFTYTVNGGKLTATCTAGCDKGYDTTPLTLTLTAPASLVYDGNVKAFTFANGEADAWTGAGLELPTFEYYLDKPETSWLDGLDGDPIAAAEGYVVKIRVGVKAAQVEFNIDKATPYIMTKPEPTDIVYGKKLSDSTLVGGYVQVSSTNTTQVGGLFEWKLGDTIPALSDSETTEYDVTFTPADTNNYNTVSCKVKIKVTHTHNFTGNYIEYDKTNHKWAKKCECGEYDTANALTGVDAPTANTGLVYDNSEKNGVSEATGYTVTDGKKTAAGEYTATATLASGYIWSDGTTAAKEIKWSIAKAAVTAPANAGSKVFTGNTLTADVDCTGKPYTVTTNNGGKAVGNYDVVLTLTDSANYKWSDSEDETKTLKFSITKADNAWTTEPKIDGVTYGTAISPVGAAKFGSVTITYVGTGDTVYNSAEAPTNAGTYKATFSVTATKDYGALTKDVPFTIAKKSIVGATVVYDENKVYNGQEQTFGVTSVTIDGLTATFDVSGNKATDYKGGGYTLTITGNGNYIGTITKNFAITKKAATITVDAKTKVYGETDPALTATVEGTVGSDALNYTVKRVTGENAGEYALSIELGENPNYEISKVETAKFTITKKAVETPAADTTNFVYNGNDQTYTIVANDLYTVSGNVQKNAGTYNVTVALKDKANYKWANGDSDDLTYTFTIAKAQNAIHDLTIGNWKDTDNALTPKATVDFGADSIVFTYYKGASKLDAVPTVAGEYTVKAEVVGTDNYDGATAETSFTIYESQKSGGDSGENEKPAVKIETESGFDPNLILEVEVVVKADEIVAENHEAIVEYEELTEKFEKIAGVYDVRLLLNGTEIQPEDLGEGTVVTVRMLVPEHLIGREFRILHVHAEEDIQPIVPGEEAGVGTYIIDDEGYLVTKIDRLSEFVFMYQPDCAIHWAMIAILVLFVVAFAVFALVMKKKLLAFIACGVCGVATIVLAFFGGCVICTVFTVINLVVIAAGTLYTLFFAKEDDTVKAPQE